MPFCLLFPLNKHMRVKFTPWPERWSAGVNNLFNAQTEENYHATEDENDGR